jgi:hypothetical protein
MDKVLLARYLQDVTSKVPAVIPLLSEEAKALTTRSIKADAEDLASISAAYHDEITGVLIDYFGGGSVTAPRNEFNRATLDAFNVSFDAGWVDGGQELPIDEDALSWINARIEQEFGYIAMLFEQAKQLRKDKEFDYFAWITERADGYVRTLREIFNTGKLMAMKDQMVTFDGDDGAESCPDCQKLKGKRKKISWFVNHDYVPPFGVGLECHPGRRCQHGLFNDKGEQITV